MAKASMHWMWHDQLLLTFLSTLCSFCSLSFHFFSFCLSSDKHRVQLKSEYPTTISQHPPTSLAVPMPLLDSGTFPRSFWLDSARGSRDTAYLSTFPIQIVVLGVCGWLAVSCLLPTQGAELQDKLLTVPARAASSKWSYKMASIIQHCCPSGVQPGMFWHTSPGGKMM